MDRPLASIVRPEKIERRKRLARAFLDGGIDAVNAAADGGFIPLPGRSAPIIQSAAAEYWLASGCFAGIWGEFDAEIEGASLSRFTANPVQATGSGTTGLERLFKADGTAIDDLSAGPGDTEIKLSETATTPSYSIALIGLRLRLTDNR
jgi:hypothetical protein